MIHNGGRYLLVIAKVGRKSTGANPLGEKVIHLNEVPSVTPTFCPQSFILFNAPAPLFLSSPTPSRYTSGCKWTPTGGHIYPSRRGARVSLS